MSPLFIIIQFLLQSRNFGYYRVRNALVSINIIILRKIFPHIKRFADDYVHPFADFWNSIAYWQNLA